MFCFLSDEQLHKVNESRFEVEFNPDEVIFKQGGPLTHIVCITKGLAKIKLEDDSNRALLLSIAKPTNMVGGPGFLTDYRHHFSVVALEKTVACFIEANMFKEIMSDNTTFSMEMISYLNKRIMMHYERLTSLTHKHMHGRIADALLYLADAIYTSDSFTTTLSRQDLADYSAMTKESAIRILKEFKDEGVISFSGDQFEILNKQSLVNISEKG